MFGLGLLFFVALAVIFVLVLLTIFSRLYIKVPPNTLAVFYGRKYVFKDAEGKSQERGFLPLRGGGRIKVPFIEKVEFMDIRSKQLKVEVKNVPNIDGVLVTLSGVATIKPDTANEENVSSYVERFLSAEWERTRQMLDETLTGAMREMAGSLTIEEMIKDRELLNQKVLGTAAEMLSKIGWYIDTFPIQEITDEQGYIEALGKKVTAEVKRDAAIGEAEAEAEATEKTSTANKNAAVVVAENARAQAEAEKTSAVEQAAYKVEQETAEAKAGKAKEIELAKQDQVLKVEAQRAEEKEQAALIGVNKQRALAETELKNAEVIVPAKAEADRKIAEAAGVKTAAITQAEGEKQALVLQGEGTAAKTRAEGQAEGDVIKALLVGEADGLDKKAEAFKKLPDIGGELVRLDMIVKLINESGPELISQLSKVVGAITAPLGEIESLTVYDSGNGNGKSALGRVAGTLPTVILDLVQQAKAAGFDFNDLLGMAGIQTAGTASAGETAPAEEPAPAETADAGAEN